MRWRSIALRFPALMTGAVLAVGATFVWAAYTQLAASLEAEVGERMRNSARLLAPAVGGPTTPRTIASRRVTRDPAVRRFASSGTGAAEAKRVLESTFSTLDSAAVRTRIVDGT